MLTALGAGGGPLLGLFLLGMFFPCVNSAGALSGLALSTLSVFWVAIGAIVKQVPQPELPVSTEGCPVTTNATEIVHNILQLHLMTPTYPDVTMPPVTSDEVDLSGLNIIYKLSFLWYPAFAVVICLITGVLVSALTGWTSASHVDARLIYPAHRHLCCCFPRRVRNWLNCASLWTYNVEFSTTKHFREFDDEGGLHGVESDDDVVVSMAQIGGQERESLLAGSQQTAGAAQQSGNGGFEVELEQETST